MSLDAILNNICIIAILLVIFICIVFEIMDLIQEIKHTEEYEKDEWRHR